MTTQPTTRRVAIVTGASLEQASSATGGETPLEPAGEDARVTAAQAHSRSAAVSAAGYRTVLGAIMGGSTSRLARRQKKIACESALEFSEK